MRAKTKPRERYCRRVWVVSELFYPEDTSTGYYMTRIAEGLARRWDVSVITGQPNYSKKSVHAPIKEKWRGIDITRCPATRLDKNNLVLRLVNASTISIAIFVTALSKFRGGDVVIVVTNPPTLPFLVMLACLAKGARCILKVDDVYPDAIVASGLLASGSKTVQFGRFLMKWLLNHVDGIVVVGRCMREQILKKMKDAHDKIEVIAHWADVDEIDSTPKTSNLLLNELGVLDRFVVLIAGNMGRLQDLDTIFKAMTILRHRNDIHFLFIGSGAKMPWMKRQVEELFLQNVTILSNRPRNEQSLFLNACDVALVSLKKGMEGLGVPSRFYNHIAAGRPIISMIESESEISKVVREEKIGWVTEPGDANGLARCIEDAWKHRKNLGSMRKRARKLAENKCSPSIAIKQYEGLVEKFIGDDDLGT